MAAHTSMLGLHAEHRQSYMPASPNPSSLNDGSYASWTSDAYQPSYASSSQRPASLRKKLVCVGDGGCGKTCLLMMYCRNTFPTDYVPTVFETYVKRVTVGQTELRTCDFSLWDTAGQEEYDRLRPLSYPETDIVIMCFAVDYPPSLHNIEDKWFPEVAHFCGETPIIVVATKTDLRQDQRANDLLAAQGTTTVSTAQGMAVARRIGARYAECSARFNEGVQEVFALALDEATRGPRGSSFGKRARRQARCTVL